MMPTIAASTPSPRGRLATEVVSTTEGLGRLRDEWHALLPASAAPNPFLTWEWAHTWWTHFGGAAALHLIAVRDGDELVALAPLMATRSSLPYASRLELIGLGLAGADYVDAIVRHGYESHSRDALARAIDAQPAALYLDHLAPGSFVESLSEPLVRSGWTVDRTSPDVCPVIDLSGHANLDSYLAGLGASHRANVRRRLRQLNARFDVRFAPAATVEESTIALERLITFHQERFGERSTAFASPAAQAFHRDIVRHAHHGGWLRMFTLSLNGEIAAVMYGFAMHRCFYFYQHGFHADYADQGAGLVLMALTIQAAIDERLDLFDMLYGHEPYKYLWARDERPLGRLQLFPPHLGGTLLRQQVATRRALRSVAQHLGLRP